MNKINFGRIFTIVMLFVAAFSLLAALLMAVRFVRQPFPGIMVEQSLVIAGMKGEGWGGEKYGNLQRVIAINTTPVNTASQFSKIIITLPGNQQITIQTIQPNGSQLQHQLVMMRSLPGDDAARLFWLPWGIGLIILSIGIFVLRERSRSRASQVFAYFCANAAIVNGLFFDLATTHLGNALWTFSLAQLGGAVIALAVVLPEGIVATRRQSQVRLLAYGISALLAIWGWIELFNEANPWGYIYPWRASYIFLGVAFFTFIGVQASRLRISLNPLARQQVRLVLWGAVMSFTPIGLWLVAQLVWPVPFNPVLFLPLLLLFPLAIMTAIIRYRMWDIDLIIRRTVIYTVLTVFLLVVYFFLILFFDYVFTRLLGRSILSSVISTFIIVLLFTPLRRSDSTLGRPPFLPVSLSA